MIQNTSAQPGDLARQQVAERSTLISVATNVVLTVVQVLAGWLSGSQGLIADGIHSLSDLLADFVVLQATRHSQKAADEDHQYGHLRYETAASLALGVLLSVVGAGMVINGARKMLDLSLIAPVHGMAIWVALGALLIKEFLFRYMLAAARKVGSSMLEANAWHARSDAASSLVVAIGIGGNLMGFHLFDPLAALVVGAMVGRMGWKFSWNALSDLMDRAASDEQVAQLHACLLDTPGVSGLHDLRTRMMGDRIVVDVHLEVDGDLTVRQGHDISVAARLRVVQAFPVLYVTTHLDPAGEEDLDS